MSADEPASGPGASAGGDWGALQGIRIVDLSHMLSGPYCTMILADHGADVVKVESLDGDGARKFGPFPDAAGDEPPTFGGYFQSVNRNKRSIAVDLKTTAGKEVVRRFATTADVLVENFRPGVMDRLGLSYESLRPLNKGLVYAAIRGFGDPRTGAGPMGDLPAFDLTAQAMGGFMSITGPPGEPFKAGPGIGDMFPGVLCCVGILSALVRRQATGEGQYLDIAMYDAMVSLCERIVYQYSYTGTAPKGQGNDHPILSPYGVFPTADGHVTIAAPSDDLWRKLCDCIERPDLADDDAFATVAARIHRSADIFELLRKWTESRTNAEVFAVLAGNVPIAPVQDAAAIAADPQVAARDMIVPLDHPGAAGPLSVAGVPIKMAGTPGGVRHRAPNLGEHTDAVLADLGFTADDIDAMKRSGAVR